MSEDNSNSKTLSLSEIEKKLQDVMEAVEILKKGDHISVSGESIAKKYEELKKQFEQKSADYTKLDEQFKQLSQEVLELRQEKMMFEQFTNLTESEKDKMQKTRDEMKQKYETERQATLESEQEKMFMEKSLEIETKEKEKAKTKYYKVIIVSVLAIAMVSGVYSVMFAEIAGEQYRVQIEPKTSGYTIQNLKGDVITTWLSWKLADGDTLHINILNSEKYDSEIIDAVKRTIISDEIFEIDNSLMFKGPKGTSEFYYVGWKGALDKAAESDTISYVPSKIKILESASGEGDITIELVDYANADGFAGWTNSIADEVENQILKARITIFDSDKLTPVEMETVLRHELGHAFGLAHSSAPEDLMAPVISTEYPYISPCDLDAIISLYDGSETSQIICDV